MRAAAPGRAVPTEAAHFTCRRHDAGTVRTPRQARATPPPLPLPRASVYIDTVNEEATTADGDAPLFDTLHNVRRLTDVDFTPDQAEALVNQQADLLRHHVASKADVELLRKDIDRFQAVTRTDIDLLRKDVERFRAETKTDIGRFRAETKTDFDRFRAETRAEFDLVRKDIVHLETRIDDRFTTMQATMTAKLETDLRRFTLQMMGMFLAYTTLILAIAKFA